MARWKRSGLPTAPGFAVGVQWHPEYDWRTDAVSRGILASFGEAVRARLTLATAAAAE